MNLPWTEIVLRLALAAIFGAAIGLERERKDWAAGMRTHMMVAMGSALIMLVSSFGFNDIVGESYAELDPSRVAAQIVSGIGFIGAGTILFRKPATILGLTTASGLWTVAGIGMATGGGMYFAASAATVFSLIILWALHPLQKKISNKFHQKLLIIHTKGDTNPRKIINRLLEDKDLDFANFSITRQKKDLMLEVMLEKSASNRLLDIIDSLQAESYVKKISWKK
ncbi:MgtC/SapB family protein [Flavobacterium sp. NRK1]|uniref:MgtC/SapB family protein n=1 Tax=Flavobacterium sp. NRK1 TaxID=2954929 RepID=UPI002091EBBA|nr:MgtC/SapB family protein [Flavobacterium sp. NRK1]MCO6148291.1 MgtC/SapB family protein [Flavobacterium sp. NRK1]